MTDREYLTAWLQQQRDLMAKATPGPWNFHDAYIKIGDSSDAALSVSAVNAHPALLAMVERFLEGDSCHICCGTGYFRNADDASVECFAFACRNLAQLAADLREAGR